MIIDHFVDLVILTTLDREWLIRGVVSAFLKNEIKAVRYLEKRVGCPKIIRNMLTKDVGVVKYNYIWKMVYTFFGAYNSVITTCPSMPSCSLR